MGQDQPAVKFIPVQIAFSWGIMSVSTAIDPLLFAAIAELTQVANKGKL
jgi:hypothetical protein